MLSILWDIAVWTIAVGPLAFCIGWPAWMLFIRPALIPKADIVAIADWLIAEHGDKAAEIAFQMHQRAWAQSEPFDQGKWRRVRHEIARRVRP